MTTAPSPTEESAPPALYEHCITTYRAMLSQAKAVVPFGVARTSGDAGDLVDIDIVDERKSIIVYEGYLTRLVTGDLNFSVPYYTAITKALVNMGCIRQLKRGGGTSPSQWELVQEPTLDAFMNAQPKKTPKQTKESMLQDQILSLNARVSELETTVEAMLEALAEQFGTSPKKD